MRRTRPTASALSARLRFEIGRLHRRTHPASYYRALARRFPLTGAPVHALPPAPSLGEARLLPGLRVHAGGVEYAGALELELPWVVRAALDRHLRAASTEEERALLAAEGLLFGPAPRPTGAPVLVLSPHRDDAALSVGGTLLARGERPLIVDLFTVSGWTSPALTRLEVEAVTRLRAAEEELSAALLGGSALALGHWEIDLRSFYAEALEGRALPRGFRFLDRPGLRGAAERAALRAAVRSAASLHRPERVYAPLGLGGHADHVYARELAIELWAAGLGARELLLYEDLPYAETEAERGESVADRLAARGIALQPEDTDVTAVLPAKERAVRAHRSQWEASFGAALAANASRRGGGPGRGGERAWRVRTLAQGMPGATDSPEQ